MRCRIPRIHSIMLSKNKRGEDWQEASHGLAKQKSQFSMCAVSQSSGKCGTGKIRPVEFKPNKRPCYQRTSSSSFASFFFFFFFFCFIFFVFFFFFFFFCFFFSFYFFFVFFFLQLMVTVLMRFASVTI